VVARNHHLPDYKRVAGYILWDKDFPRTASMKIKRAELADQIRNSLDRSAAVKEF
jgi:acyl-coenzyme A synthetase/AMP-(fatty) acid ligase